jgi:hypothetical protein
MSKYNDSELYITTFGIGLVGLSNITSSSSDIKITAGVICISSACGFIVDLLNSKYKKIFTNCGLINKDNETPRLKNMLSHIIWNSEKMIFSIPIGLCQDDFLKVKSQLEVAFNKNINLVYNDDFTITIENNNNINLTKDTEIKFISCGLISKYKITPTLINKDRNQWIYKIPDGLCYEDFIKVKSQLEVAFNMPLKLTNNKDDTITFERDNNV